MSESTTGFYPPISNTGVERLSVRPDWVDLTLAARDGWDPVRTWVGLDLGKAEMGRGHGFYERAIRADDGTASLGFGGRGDAEWTALLTLRGGYWSATGTPDAALARVMLETDGRPARLDLAADFGGAAAPVADLAEAFRQGKARTRLRAGRELRDLRTGARTVYLGAGSSDHSLRMYDMRGYLRVELQARNGLAQDLAASILENGSWGAWRAAVGRMVDFPTVAAWRAMLDCPGPS